MLPFQFFVVVLTSNLVANDEPELVDIPTDIHCGLGGIPVRLSTNNILIEL